VESAAVKRGGAGEKGPVYHANNVWSVTDFISYYSTYTWGRNVGGKKKELSGSIFKAVSCILQAKEFPHLEFV